MADPGILAFEFAAFLPPRGPSASAEIRAAIDLLLAHLEDTGRDRRAVLALTCFVDAVDAGSWRRRRRAVAAAVGAAFGSPGPPTAVVAQAPERGRRAALEARLLLPGSPARTRWTASPAGARCAVRAGGHRGVHGVVAADPRRRGTRARAEDCFARMETLLSAEGLTFGHVVRQWNYVEGVLATGGGYGGLNDARARAYARAEFPSGFPAATGIGQAAGGVVVEFVALDAPRPVRITPLSNPRQVDAHRYSADVLGEAGSAPPPLFERAKSVEADGRGILFVSGTAAVIGERSVAPGDVGEQTRIAIENLRLVLPDGRLSNLRAYVKRARDIPAVRRACEQAFGPLPSLCVRADVCRDELLVELEGARCGAGACPAGGRA